ncbi:YbaK/EbsC family protein [Actinomycetospora aurantiaca]|uniref:YbaK/EbsC family protein n=1 Tax=Actinomycetospora aurantiaca TaxID=3129233 RepID=UPI0035A18F5D
MVIGLEPAAGTLEPVPALDRPDLLAGPVVEALKALPDDLAASCGVAAIEPDLADTAAFCEAYSSPLELSANCVVVSGSRSGEQRFAACVVLATTRADVNGVVRKRIDVRKASFAPMDLAVELTGMECGGITPFGVPADWPVLVDPAVLAAPAVVVGSGIRASKLVVPGAVLGRLSGAESVEGLGR